MSYRGGRTPGLGSPAVPSTATIELGIDDARRLAVVKQRLGTEQAPPTAAGLREIARSLRVFQLDPIAVVDRAQHLILWSRLGNHERALLDRAWWRDKFLFSYWAHAASLVLTEDLPLHRYRMKQMSSGDGGWGKQALGWIETNRRLKNHVLRELRAKGPLRVRDLQDVSEEPWRSSGWTSERNVARMLDILWLIGKVVIAGREGADRVWDLTDRWLPDSAPKRALTRTRFLETAAQISLKALGVATLQQVKEHFVPSSYGGIQQVFEGLLRSGKIVEAEVRGPGGPLKGRWFIHRDDVAVLGDLVPGSTARTTLLCPFDNLIRNRKRTELLFDFHYRIEIYVPEAERKYGYYSMPILHRDRLIGRVDPKADRKSRVLRVNSLHFEPGVDPDRSIANQVSGALEDLARFTTGGTLDLSSKVVPRGWRGLF